MIYVAAYLAFFAGLLYAPFIAGSRSPLETFLFSCIVPAAVVFAVRIGAGDRGAVRYVPNGTKLVDRSIKGVNQRK